MTVALAGADARVVEAFARRQLKWDARSAARIVTTERALGVFTAPPLGVLAFLAVPRATPGVPIDLVVPAAALADALRDGVDLETLPRALVQPTPPPSLSDLPPAEGWQVPIHAVSGDLLPIVSEAAAEFRSRSAGLGGAAQEEIAEEIWSRPGFGGLPLRSLHAARQLGMLADDMSRVSASTCGRWRRLSTVRGQVFSYAAGPAARLALRIVR